MKDSTDQTYKNLARNDITTSPNNEEMDSENDGFDQAMKDSTKQIKKNVKFGYKKTQLFIL